MMQSAILVVALCTKYITEGAVVGAGAGQIEIDADYLRGNEYNEVTWLMKNPIGVAGTLKGYRYQGKLNGGSEVHLQIWRPVDWFETPEEYYYLVIDTPTTPPSPMTKISNVDIWAQDQIEVKATDHIGLAFRGHVGVAHRFQREGSAYMTKRMYTTGWYATFNDLVYPYEFLVEAEVDVHD